MDENQSARRPVSSWLVFIQLHLDNWWSMEAETKTKPNSINVGNTMRYTSDIHVLVPVPALRQPIITDWEAEYSLINIYNMTKKFFCMYYAPSSSGNILKNNLWKAHWSQSFLKLFLKEQCHEIFDLFFAQKTPPGPHKLFRFHEDIWLKNSKFACPPKQRLSRHTIWAWGNHTPFNILKYVAIGYVTTPKYFISVDCSFKTGERPSKFAVDVSVVIVMSA